jgi:hypothetical protein
MFSLGCCLSLREHAASLPFETKTLDDNKWLGASQAAKGPGHFRDVGQEPRIIDVDLLNGPNVDFMPAGRVRLTLRI